MHTIYAHATLHRCLSYLGMQRIALNLNKGQPHILGTHPDLQTKGGETRSAIYDELNLTRPREASIRTPRSTYLE